ncbi:hypothetical protein RB653_008873 [Dictyostelium firmibasis]|uniref:T4 RNA ligase 1-like N-terminal domain-containing protein n=1 Tax=Dictyostelium firmibasis TaxID=79012 RepID=A0AAN7TTE5_9MYCE
MTQFIDRNQSYKLRNSTLFPHDLTIEDCREAIKDVVGFRETLKNGLICFNYDFCFKDSFPNPEIEPDDKKAFLYKVRRECRGLIFDEITGEIVCRKLHKFFNINEQQETKEELIKLDENFIVLEKLDGSLIAPILINGKVAWGSKSGITDLTIKVEKHVEKKLRENDSKYDEFALEWMLKGYTPLFEWCSESNQIVLYYAIDNLNLIAMRSMKTGEYLTHEEMLKISTPFNVPVVSCVDLKSHEHFSKLYTELNGASQDNTEEFINTGASKLLKIVLGLENCEGYILKFDSGRTYKMKSNWYFEYHSIAPNIKYVLEKDVFYLILNDGLGGIDDIIAKIAGTGPVPQRYNLIQEFGRELLQKVEELSIRVINFIKESKSQGKLRKHISSDNSVPNSFKNFAFRFYDSIEANDKISKHIGEVSKYIMEKLKLLCTNSSKLEECRKILGGIKFTEDKSNQSE